MKMILGAAFLQAEQFRRQIDRLRRKFLDGHDVDVLFLGVFPARFVDGAAVGVVVGQQPHLRRLFALVDGEDVVKDGLAIQAVTPEGKVHVFDRRLEDLPACRVIDRRDLVFLDDRLGGESFAGPPGGDHVHLILNGEFSDGRHRLRDLVGGIGQDHLDLVVRQRRL